MLNNPIDTLKKYVDQPSGSYDVDDVAAVADLIAADFESLGFTVEKKPGKLYGPTLICRLGSGDRQLMLMGHMDTVFPRAMSVKYTETENGIALGSGIMDMKGGIMIMLYALKQALPSIDLSRYRICAVINPDEEVGSSESHDVIIDTAQHSFAALSFEPCGLNNRLTCARKGVTAVKISTKGKPGHAGSQYFQCASAIEGLCKQIAKLYALRDEAREISFNAGTIHGGTAENVVAPDAEARCEFRYFNEAYKPEISQRILDLCAEEPVPGVTTTVTFGNFHPAIDLNDNSRVLLDLAMKISAEQGIERIHEKTGGAGDISIAGQAGIGVLDGLGMPGGKMHTVEEFACIDQIPTQIEFAAKLLTAVCN